MIPLTSPTFSQHTKAICIGSGRFLRSVLVPLFQQLGSDVIVMQTRGQSFVDACRLSGGTYEHDTIFMDGRVITNTVTLVSVGSLGAEDDKAAFLTLPSKLPALRYIGFGVTDAGIVSGSTVIRDLAEFLYRCFLAIPQNVLSIVDTDNVPRNGDAIKKFVLETQWTGGPTECAKNDFHEYLRTKVHFHNTMVDRFTSHRANNVLVPLAEPWPRKTVVIEDLDRVLDTSTWTAIPGVLIRREHGQVLQDQALKLRLNNAVSSAAIYLLSLSRLKTNNDIRTLPLVIKYLDRLVQYEIQPSLVADGIDEHVIQVAYNDWKERVVHPHFGINNFWVTQNAMMHYRVRLLKTIQVNHTRDETYRPSVYMALATALILRYLTPIQDDSRTFHPHGPVFVGAMDPFDLQGTPILEMNEQDWVYGNGLTANLSTGKYLFMDGQHARVATILARAIRPLRQNDTSTEISARVGVAIATALSTLDGFDLNQDVYASFAVDVAGLYQRMVGGTPVLAVLEDVVRNDNPTEYFTCRTSLEAYVRKSVATVQVIDVHTHLFPPSHGNLMLWGINELLTYHYLVAEYLMTAPIQVEEFNQFSKPQQAALIWQHLFIDRSPISEACRGVITTLTSLGLGDLVQQRNLSAIQAWFATQDPNQYLDLVFRIAGIKYAVMTNIPFEPEEARHWLGDASKGIAPAVWSRNYFRSALRVDQLLIGDWLSITNALDVFQLPHTLEGCRTLLIKWIDIMQPEYFMASVPISFTYSSSLPSCQPPNGSELFLKVLLPLAQQYHLPIALKFDSVRPINSRLGVAGDGVKPCNVDLLIRLCREFPKVKFMATFLSRVNQHEVTIVANKFPNLHLYGCWWYCNNPSIIDEMTRMRMEILGTAFTCQHSDARVLDQLIYKWNHSRMIITNILVHMYDQMYCTGWKISKDEIERDIHRIFGNSYEEFLTS